MSAESKPVQLTLERLKEMGAFVPKLPIAVTVSWNGTEIPLFVRRLGIGDAQRIATPIGDTPREMTAATIEVAVCLDAEGKEKFPYQEAYRLVPKLAELILTEVARINGAGVAHE